jgi:uncharacterized protein
MHAAQERELHLAAWFRDRRSVLLGFSGGIDSTYLAAVGSQVLGRDRFLAVIGRSASYPESQWRKARAAASRLGVVVREIDTYEMQLPGYTANPSNRCYFCKRELWRRLVPLAAQLGYAHVIDGTNSDDLTDHRPGRAAAAEHGVLSPLAELGFSKHDVRMALRARGVESWDDPSSPCLSSRVPYGTPIDEEVLLRIERAEDAVRRLGVRGDLRVRSHGELARVELYAGALESCASAGFLEAICSAVRSAGFARVCVDAAGFRSGSLNVLAALNSQ